MAIAILLVFVAGIAAGGIGIWLSGSFIQRDVLAQFFPPSQESDREVFSEHAAENSSDFDTSSELAERLTQVTAQKDELQTALTSSEERRAALAEQVDHMRRDKDIESVRIRRRINQLQQTHDQALLATVQLKDQAAYIAQLESHLADQRRTATILTDGVSYLETRNAKLEQQLNSTLGREKLFGRFRISAYQINGRINRRHCRTRRPTRACACLRTTTPRNRRPGQQSCGLD